ncbi:unnamed protein product [Pedinophyceae sp. YPF-701]|nr:unnamed protein product [Pedinophyceae sp. YPF-701]
MRLENVLTAEGLQAVTAKRRRELDDMAWRRNVAREVEITGRVLSQRALPLTVAPVVPPRPPAPLRPPPVVRKPRRSTRARAIFFPQEDLRGFRVTAVGRTGRQVRCPPRFDASLGEVVLM